MSIKLPHVSQSQAKQMAKNLNKALGKGGVEKSLSESQHLLAGAFGCANWQTLTAKASDSKEQTLIEAFKDYCADFPGGNPAYLLEPLVNALLADGGNRNWSLDHLQDVVNNRLSEGSRKNCLPNDYVDTGLTATAFFLPQQENSRGDIMPVWDGNDPAKYKFDIAPFLLGMNIEAVRALTDFTYESDEFASYCPEYQDHDGPYEVIVEEAIDELLEQIVEEFGLESADDVTQEIWDLARTGKFKITEFMCGIVFGNDQRVIQKLADGDNFDAAEEKAKSISADSNGYITVPWIFGSQELDELKNSLKSVHCQAQGYFMVANTGEGLYAYDLGEFDTWEDADHMADLLASSRAQKNLGVLGHDRLKELIDGIEQLLK